MDESGVGNIEDAVAFIERLRQTEALETLPIGRKVVVVGGGMTAIDAAVQAKKLGAEEVTLVYRRGSDAMPASRYEQEVALKNGVVIRHFARPYAVKGEGGILASVLFMRTALENGTLVDTGETFELPADQLFKAIGQLFLPTDVAGEDAVLEMKGPKIAVDAERRTSLPKVWAGGDCIAGGSDLTVVAVEDGKQAALSIHRAIVALMPLAAE